MYSRTEQLLAKNKRPIKVFFIYLDIIARFEYKKRPPSEGVF